MGYSIQWDKPAHRWPFGAWRHHHGAAVDWLRRRRATFAYSLLGILQYLSPTLQLLIGVWWFGEPFGADRLTGFALIWAALAIYAVDGVWRQRVGRAGAASGA